MPRKIKNDSAPNTEELGGQTVIATETPSAPDVEATTDEAGTEGGSTAGNDAVLTAATAELAAAVQDAHNAAADVGVSLPVAGKKSETADKPPKRRVLTMDQKLKRARRGAERGLALLQKNYLGVAVVKQHLQIKHGPLAKLAARMLPVIDAAAYSAERFIGVFLTRNQADEYLATIKSRLGNLAADTKNQLNVAKELCLVASTGDVADNQWEKPDFTAGPAIDIHATLRSPYSMALVRAIKDMDALVLKLEELHWNELRTSEQVMDEFMRFKNVVMNQFLLAYKILRIMHERGVAMRAAENAPHSPAGDVTIDEAAAVAAPATA